MNWRFLNDKRWRRRIWNFWFCRVNINIKEIIPAICESIANHVIRNRTSYLGKSTSNHQNGVGLVMIRLKSLTEKGSSFEMARQNRIDRLRNQNYPILIFRNLLLQPAPDIINYYLRKKNICRSRTSRDNCIISTDPFIWSWWSSVDSITGRD